MLRYIVKFFFYIISKKIIFLFLKFLSKNKISFYLFNFSYEFLYKSVSYYLNLKSDLEAVQQLSILRDKVINYKKKNKVHNKKKKIILILNLSTSNLVDLRHIKKFLKYFDLYIYEVEKKIGDSKFHYNFFKKNIKYIKKNKIKFESVIKNFNFENLSSKINKINADLLIFNNGASLIKLIDLINTKKIVSMNKTSLFVPHSKINLQTFNQPPWPYKIRKRKIYNFKTKKSINIPVTDKIFVYNKKDYKIRHVDLKNKNIILWYGNLKKLADKNFINLISKILLKYKNLNFNFFGSNIYYLNKIYKYFHYNNVKNFKYLGTFDQQNDRKKNNLKKFKSIISRTLLMTNTFKMHGGRYAIEAYDFDIPIINFQLNDKQWLYNQNEMYYKNENIFLKKFTASTFDQYENLIENVILSKKFRNDVIKNQRILFKKLTHEDKLFDDISSFNLLK